MAITIIGICAFTRTFICRAVLVHCIINPATAAAPPSVCL